MIVRDATNKARKQGWRRVRAGFLHESLAATVSVMRPMAGWVRKIFFPATCKKPLTLANQGLSFGAGEMNRTPDLLITNWKDGGYPLIDQS